MVTNEGFHLDLLDRWTAETQYKVERDQTIAYAKATNDPVGAHLDGTYAPPVFAVVPLTVLMADATMGVVPDELMMRILHGEHDFRFHRPIVPGEVLTVRAKPIGIEGRSPASSSPRYSKPATRMANSSTSSTSSGSSEAAHSRVRQV
ncbi:hypothetical protein GCM10020255_086300 [Rhodococcus baikonurensis]